MIYKYTHAMCVWSVGSGVHLAEHNALILIHYYYLQVDPAEVWLRDDCDGPAYFPQEGHFHLHSASIPTYSMPKVKLPGI